MRERGGHGGDMSPSSTRRVQSSLAESRLLVSQLKSSPFTASLWPLNNVICGATERNRVDEFQRDFLG